MANARRPRGRPLLALASAVVACGVTVLSGSARAEPRVLIEVPDGADPVLDEALNRVRGELSAVGLSADVRVFGTNEIALEPGVEGALSIARDGSLIRIRAYGPLSPNPIVQELDSRASEVTAEVVAVRAVEALRAVTIAFRKAEPKPEVKPEPPKPEVKQQPPKPEVKPLAPPRRARPALAPRGGHGALNFAAAPNAFYDLDSRTLGLGAELGVFYGRFPCFVGPALGSTLYRPPFEVPAGSVDSRRISVALRAGCALELAEPFELWLSLGGGLAFYSAEGHAATGFVGHRVEHTAPFAILGVGGTAWLTPFIGVFTRVDASVAINAGAIRVAGSEIATLERPLFWGALGVVLHVPGVL